MRNMNVFYHCEWVFNPNQESLSGSIELRCVAGRVKANFLYLRPTTELAEFGLYEGNSFTPTGQMEPKGDGPYFQLARGLTPVSVVATPDSLVPIVHLCLAVASEILVNKAIGSEGMLRYRDNGCIRVDEEDEVAQVCAAIAKRRR